MDLIVVLYFITVKWNEIRRKELLVLQGASTSPAPEGFYFWERENRQQQFQHNISLCSFLIKRFAAKKTTQSRGNCWHCVVLHQASQRLPLLPSFTTLFWEEMLYSSPAFPGRSLENIKWSAHKSVSHASCRVFFSQHIQQTERLVVGKGRICGHADTNQDRISLVIFTDFWPNVAHTSATPDSQGRGDVCLKDGSCMAPLRLALSVNPYFLSTYYCFFRNDSPICKWWLAL